MNSVRQRFSSIHWYLAIFESALIAVVLVAFGLYLDHQLSAFAQAELGNRLLARLGNPPLARKATDGHVRFRDGGSGGNPTLLLTRIATFSALSDRAGVTTTVLNAQGQAVKPDSPPAGWQSLPDLAPDLFKGALASRQALGPERVASGRQRYMVLYQAVGFRGQGPAGVVQLSIPTAEVEALVLAFRWAMGLGILATVLLTFLAGQPLSRLALARLRRLAKQIGHISPDSLGERVPVPRGRDELRDLAIAFNQLLERIEQSIRTERRTQEQLRRFVDDASHELRSPLTALLGYVDLLLEPEAITDTHAVALRMQRELRRMAGLSNDLLALTRLDAALARPPRPRPVDVAAMASEVLEAFSLATGNRQMRLQDESRGQSWIQGDRDGLERLLENLLRNAVQHTTDDGQVGVRLRVVAGAWLELSVVDDGEGIAPEHQARIFDRFYRLDAARARGRGNVGLGLAIVKAIAQQHGGEVTVESAPGRGSTFIARLPSPSFAPPAPAETAPSAAPLEALAMPR